MLSPNADAYLRSVRSSPSALGTVRVVEKTESASAWQVDDNDDLSNLVSNPKQSQHTDLISANMPAFVVFARRLGDVRARELSLVGPLGAVMRARSVI